MSRNPRKCIFNWINFYLFYLNPSLAWIIKPKKDVLKSVNKMIKIFLFLRMIDIPGIVRHWKRQHYLCVERLNKEESINFPFIIMLGRLTALCSHMQFFFFSPSGHVKDQIKIALGFYLYQTDYHKPGSLKEHLFNISPFPPVRNRDVGGKQDAS